MISERAERMGIELVPKRKQAVIVNLMQLYLYDFTKYLDISVNDQGLFYPIPISMSFGRSGNGNIRF